MGKLILPPPDRTLLDNTSRRVLNSFRLGVCRTIRFSDKPFTIPLTTISSSSTGSLAENTPCTD